MMNLSQIDELGQKTSDESDRIYKLIKKEKNEKKYLELVDQFLELEGKIIKLAHMRKNYV